jgi:hypothetical protein
MGQIDRGGRGCTRIDLVEEQIVLRRIVIVSIVGCTLLAVTVVAAIAVALMSVVRADTAKMSQVEQHLAAHQAELNDAVLAVLAAHPDGGRVKAESLPLALKAAEVWAASCGPRHVTLFVTHNPDTDHGFRIWSGVQDSDYDDAPTSIPGVYQFRYCDDYPESTKNRAD